VAAVGDPWTVPPAYTARDTAAVEEHPMTDTNAVPSAEQVNGFLLVHAALRKGGSDLRDAAGRFRPGTDNPAPLVRLWGFYERGLRHHHQGEDDVVFPLVVRRRPDFAGVEAELQAEHATIDERLEASANAVGELGAQPTDEHAVKVHDALGELVDVLERHLAHEEKVALPVIASVVTDAEMAKIEKGFLRTLPRRDLGLSLAALDATVAAHPELHLPPVPKPARLLLALVWRRQYRSLLAAAGL
jgi:hemerythrin-like domain-containing protein